METLENSGNATGSAHDETGADDGSGGPEAWNHPPRGRSRTVRRALIGAGAAVAGCAVLGGVLVLLPGEETPRAGALPGPAGRAAIAAAVGAPAALPDLTALIREREAGVREHPRDDGALAELGAAYVERGTRTARTADFPRAERALRDSLRARPNGNAAALDGLAALAVARGDWPGARAFGERARKLAPRRWSSYAYLVDAYQGLGNGKAAGKNLEKLTELASGTAVTLRTVAVYRDRGWREDAEAVLSDAVARAGTPAEQAALLARGGELAWERGDAAGALRHFDAALGADPDSAAALAGRGRALTSLGRSSEALRAYRRAIELRPAPAYVLELGELYESLGMADAARTEYDALRQRGAGEVDVVVLGRLEADHGDAGAAVSRLRAAWKRAPSVGVADALGWALHRAGDDREALGYLRRATDRQKAGTVRVAGFMYHRGVVERELDLAGPARRHLGEALRINPAFSPLDAPRARAALDSLGEPDEGGPAQMWAPKRR
ncbi:tetratricopeptide repeat protein [Streptomyces xanthii]|uniref:Tetratricopeptide repeat protein n=1 Tax=Streptomyces xanthii TaxID=2768069 RepID=A0A7H1BB45_9ACTN|nr:tetratricopeptide repeat protein [Streptomyces xanthii]QNS05950.1 tetratricopeptide repeat protein [Streptomyces xanthii]